MSFSIISQSLKIVAVNSLRKFHAKNQLNQVQNVLQFCGHRKVLFSSKPSDNILYEKDPQTGEIKKKKTTIIPKITLLFGNDVSITTIEEAQKLAKRRDLKLVKIIDLDTKTDRPVYRLMSGTEYLHEDLKQKENMKFQKQNSLKGEKLLMISQNISEHDIDVHITKILKWLTKKYEVRLVINGSSGNMSKAENVYSLIEKKLKPHNSRIVQKRTKGSDIKFQVLPPKQDQNQTAKLSTGGSSNSVSSDDKKSL